ncbi:MAG: tRNA (guanosine(46)-N7)-methyltransferase TrmB [Mycobacteriales bacterium]
MDTSLREPVRTYKVRRRVTLGQREALERLLPVYGVPVDVRVAEAFGRQAPLVLEIGSGMGEATAAMAAADPERDLLAVEVHTPGIGNLLRLVDTAGLTNVRVLEADAREVLAQRIGPGELDEVRLFFPDPWPKSRHAKRRLVTAQFADLVADRLRPGGRLHVATDWTAYAAQALGVLAAHRAFDIVSRERGARPPTRFEQRGSDAGRASYDLVAVRRGSSDDRIV